MGWPASLATLVHHPQHTGHGRETDAGQFVIAVKAPSGTRLLDTEKEIARVEQLIRETDEAFHAVGTALADVKAATQAWHDDTVFEPVARNVAISRRRNDCFCHPGRGALPL